MIMNTHGRAMMQHTRVTCAPHSTSGATANAKQMQGGSAPEDGGVASMNDLHDLAQLLARQLVHVGAQRLFLVDLQRDVRSLWF